MQRMHKYEKIASSDLADCETCKLSHNCNLNYTGSSPEMEAAGATKILVYQKRSMGYITPLFMEMLTEAYPTVKDIYGPTKPIKKFECVGHYQKRVGLRLRNLKEKKEKKKGLGGKGKLTNTKIDTM